MASIVIPSLNERKNLEKRIPRIYEVLDKDTEVLIVDGESTDDTRGLVEKFQKKYSNLKYRKQSGEGFANALREGLRRASGEEIVSMDAENHDPAEIPKILSKLREGFDVVIGSRFMEDSQVDLEKHRLASTKIANKIATRALDLGVKDTSSGFRAYRKPVLDKILEEDFRTQYFSVQVEILEKAVKHDAQIAEVGVTYLRREAGESKFDFNPAIKDAKKLLEIAGEKKLDKFKKT